MTTGIDVFFTGLMLLCVNGGTNCPPSYYAQKDYPNTAWVIEADGHSTICGWKSKEKTELTVKFSSDSFMYSPSTSCDTAKNDIGEVIKVCPLSAPDICVFPEKSANENLLGSLAGLPRFEDVDRRLVGPDVSYFSPNSKLVPARINFASGKVSAGDRWPIGGGLIRWYRSDGDTDEILPRAFSDRLKVTYEGASYLKVTDCKGKDLIVLTVIDSSRLAGKDAEVVFQNVSSVDPKPAYGDGYDELTYLLWYYRLGEWDTKDRKCPDYYGAKKPPVLLRCVSKEKKECSYYPGGAADHRFWPPILGPRVEKE